MIDNIRILLDLLALGAIAYAIAKGVFSAGSGAAYFKTQLEFHSRWIKDHEACNEKQIAILTEVREDLAYLRGRFDAEKEQV